MNQLKLATKLWLAVGLIVASMTLLVAGMSMRAGAIQASGRDAVAAVTEQMQLTQEWASEAKTNAARLKALGALQGSPVVEELKTQIFESAKLIDQSVQSMGAAALAPTDAAYQKAKASTAAVMAGLPAALEDLKTGGPQAYGARMGPLLKSQTEDLRALGDSHKARFKQVQQSIEEARVGNIKLVTTLIAALMVGLLVGARWLIHSISGPLEQAIELAERIASGDLSQHVKVNRGDEFGKLMGALQSMNVALSKMIHTVRQSIDSIATASTEIATGNNDLAMRTEQTAGNLQATASSMEHITQMVSHSADSARQASSLATAASDVAKQGGSVVSEVVQTMDAIQDSSKRISDIIGVIDGIAFQTNILALNAAVEAARAGEQGRGFAVVASEVRSLASRSAEAAREIKQLISTSVERVENGTRLVTAAGQSMQGIVTSVGRVNDVVGEISSAAVEQSEGIAGVNAAIAKLDGMTQQNAALVEQSAAAAQSLKHQADELSVAVSVFKLQSDLEGA